MDVVSFFTGAMGLDLGLEQAGFTVRLACEKDKSARETIQHNRPALPLVNNIVGLTAADVREKSGIGDGELFLVSGGPPCQSFSTAGKRKGTADRRGSLLSTFVRLGLDLRPRYILLENVRGLLSANDGTALADVLSQLRSAGYAPSFELYDAANFGVAQRRERLILIASRDNTRVGYLASTHSKDSTTALPPWRTFRDVCGEMQDDATYVQFSAERLALFQRVGPGQNWRSLPADLQKKALGNANPQTGGNTGYVRRLAWDKPSFALVTHPAMRSTALGHPVRDRPLSVQEYRCLQSFPATFVVKGTTLSQYRQLGNAVPVLLGKAAGEAILRHAAGRAGITPIQRFSRYRNTDDKSWETVRRNKRSRREEDAKKSPQQ